MKFLHVADLHFGKMMHGVSLLDNGDQPAWVERFLALAEETRPDAVLIAGDVYDRSSPSGEAVELFGRLVEGLAGREIPVMIVAGNHDSGQRLGFARGPLARQGIYVAGVPAREMVHVTLKDEFGPVTFWLMPYLFPAAAAQLLEDPALREYDPAVRALLAAQDLDLSRRNVIVAHQNVTCAGRESPRGGSETMVGGVGQVEYTAFDAFEYAALGHIHAGYPVGRETVRYAGSPLCYHFDELRQTVKGPLLVELGPKGAPVSVTVKPIAPLHPLRELKGPLEELRAAELARQTRGEYLRLVVTDQPMTPEISGFFQELAKSRDSVLMERLSQYRAAVGGGKGADLHTLRTRRLEELFEEFYRERTGGEDLSPQDRQFLEKARELAERDGTDPRHPGTADPALAQELMQELLREGSL